MRCWGAWQWIGTTWYGEIRVGLWRWIEQVCVPIYPGPWF